jgi:hypothetical protein
LKAMRTIARERAPVLEIVSAMINSFREPAVPID